jgi:hypothetical protein
VTDLSSDGMCDDFQSNPTLEVVEVDLIRPHSLPGDFFDLMVDLGKLVTRSLCKTFPSRLQNQSYCNDNLESGLGHVT